MTATEAGQTQTRRPWRKRHPFLAAALVLLAALLALWIVHGVRVQSDLKRMYDTGRLVERAVLPGMTADEARAAAAGVGVELHGPYDLRSWDLGDDGGPFVMQTMIRHRVMRFPVYSERQIKVHLDEEQRVLGVETRWAHTGP